MKAKSVDFKFNDVDLEVALLGEAGWHTKSIARKTRLTESQVLYRLGLAKIKRSDYRNGKSAVASLIVGIIRNPHSAQNMAAETDQFPKVVDSLQHRYIVRTEKSRREKRKNNGS